MSNGSGTGTPATAPDEVTAGELLATIRAALGDAGAATWSDAELLGFLGEAVREYSQHRPRIGEATLAAVAEQQQYALPGDATAVLSVEYPLDAEPPSFIYRTRVGSRRFRDGAHRYDFLARRDLTNPPRLWLSFAPDDGSLLRVRFVRPHVSDLAGDTPLTVPAEHHHVLAQYVLFAAARRLQQREQANPTSSGSVLMAQLASNTRRLELAYLNALNRILTHALGEGEIVTWEELAR